MGQSNSLSASAMTPNGTAIGVACVTGAANRPIVLFVGMELSRLQAGIACPDLSGAQYLPSRCARALSRSRHSSLLIDDSSVYLFRILSR